MIFNHSRQQARVRTAKYFHTAVYCLASQFSGFHFASLNLVPMLADVMHSLLATLCMLLTYGVISACDMCVLDAQTLSRPKKVQNKGGFVK